MLDINFIRQNPDVVKKGIASKNVNPDLVDIFLAIDDKWKKLVKNSEELKAEQKKVGKDNIDKAKKIKIEIQELENLLMEAEIERQKILESLPNLPFNDVPVGKNEDDNIVIREVGAKPEFDFTAKDHLELGENLNLIEFEIGAKVSGSGFYYLKNEAVLLEFGLIRYVFDILKEEGFEILITPDLARKKFYTGTGYLPKGPEAQIYEIKDVDLGLIATSEITLAGIHSDEILEKDDLPKKYAGFSHCFRMESGGYGKYSKGLYRVNQFSKVEMYIYCLPEESEKFHKHLLDIEEKIFKSLIIPYQVLEMCAGDLGNQAAKKYDLEAWMPGRGAWGEITSTSNTTDFQARRLNIKYRENNKKSNFVHTLNGTAIALPRVIIAILENYQQKDGSVLMPEVLQKYLGFNKISR
ncbi:MAG: serine--tRNA ligase [Patescibacteria group bacterium]